MKQTTEANKTLTMSLMQKKNKTMQHSKSKSAKR